MVGTVIQAFKDVFGPDATPRVFFAPGRVNLIGEHTDYNGGHVLPCALKRGTYAAAVKREDTQIRLYSCNFKSLGVTETSVEVMDFVATSHWTDYPLGMFQIFRNKGFTFDSGFDICFIGDIPNGAGLSSSASIELVTGVIFNAFYNLDLNPIELVKLAQQAENEFVGVKCGIMDQFIIGLGKEHHAILLDTTTLDYTYAKVDLDQYALLISNTNKKRGLADSKYNERFEECQKALTDLQAVVAIESLGDLSEEAFESHALAIKDPVARRRARHAVTENQRTINACKALNEGRLEDFGLLMNASHYSLKHDYEVTCNELDTLVSLSQQFEGVIGSRMTGAGFGGCTVTLIEKKKVPRFIEIVGEAYQQLIGYAADFYPVEIGDGAREL
jgi:galactokinase